jgi:hypothetical protein
MGVKCLAAEIGRRRNYSLGNLRYLWKCWRLGDFPVWHLLKCAVFGWTPLPDRIFTPTPMFTHLKRKAGKRDA